MVEKDFRAQLDEVHKMGLAPARQIVIDLSTVTPDRELNIAGNFFYIKDAPGLTEYIEVKVNSSGTPAVSWSKQTGFIQPFNRLYITTPAGQAGTMKILIASEAPTLFNILDHRSAISLVMQSVLDELQGDVTPKLWKQENIGTASYMLFAANADRKSFSIQAKSTNTGIVYIGFDPSVTSVKWWAELQPGQSCNGDDYRGPLHAIASVAAGNVVGYAEV